MDLDADRDEILLDQVEDVGLLGRGAGGLDGEFQASPVREMADALAVALGKADLVEQAVGLGEVRRHVELRQGLVIERAFRQRSVAALLGEAEEDDAVDVAPVDRQRKCAAIADIAVEIAPDRVDRVEIGHQREPGAFAAFP